MPLAREDTPSCAVSFTGGARSCQFWFNLADFDCEEALYDSASLRRFARIDLGSEAVLDRHRVVEVSRILETHKPGEQLFAEVGRKLQSSGMGLESGT
jgi:transposase, IS5 family